MEFFLASLSGICWTIVYIQSIRIGFKDKTYAMPFIALALNITWEGLYFFIGLMSTSRSVNTWFNVVWFLLDILIFYTYFKFGKNDFSKYVNKKYFVPWSILIFLMSFVIQYYFNVQFGKFGAWYSAFIQNLIMSILYINMLVIRESVKGQSLTIAICKWIGTLAPTILFGIIYGNQLVLVLGIFCSVFDIIYIFYLNSALRVSYSHSGSTTYGNSKKDLSING